MDSAEFVYENHVHCTCKTNNIFRVSTTSKDTGRERLIRTRLIRSST